MSINIAFKTPDALVFVTDGLSTLIEVDALSGEERIVSSIVGVEKLIPLGGGQLLAMFNGLGSFHRGSIASELRSFDAEMTLGPGQAGIFEYAQRLRDHIEAIARRPGQSFPGPFHLILGGFEGKGPQRLPLLFSIKWSRGSRHVPPVEPILHVAPGDTPQLHRFGPYYAGLTAPVARFVEGSDPELRELAAMRLVGLDDGAPGILEELIHRARAQEPAAPGILPNRETRRLALEYAGRILHQIFTPESNGDVSEHFSLQEAVNYSVFLALCAYARENWSPLRRGPARVGSTLQIAYLPEGGRVVPLRSINVGVNLGVTE